MAPLSSLVALAGVPLLALSSGSEEWPHWRGPHGTGAALEADPPIHWAPDRNIVWKTELPGHGKSTPIVMDGRIYVLAAEPTRKATPEELAARPAPEGSRDAPPDTWMRFWVLAVEASSGKLLWKTAVAEKLPHAGTHRTNGYASSSPVTDGKTVFASFGSQGVYALDAAEGKVLWSQDIGPQHMRNDFGEAASPTLWKDTLILAADQEEDSALFAFDAKSGKVRWRTPRDEVSTWTTPLIVEAGGKAQVVVNGSRAVRAYDLTSGAELWRCDGQTANAIPTPVTDGEVVVATSGFRGSACMALSLTGQGNLRESRDAIHWSHTGGTPYVPSPVLVDGRVFFLAGNTGQLSCLDLATGEVLVDRERLELTDVYASPMAAADRIYVTDRSGATVVVRHTGDGLEVLARNVLDDPIDATPVAVGKRLYLRSDTNLYAIEER